jgi:hypothetical protein
MERFTRIARWSSGIPGCWLLGILVNLVIGSVQVCPVHTLGSTLVDVPEQFTFQDGKLTARIVGTSLQQVMAEVTRLSRVEVRWMDAAVREQVVWAEFTALPLSDAVRRMLRETNFLLWYVHSDEGTRLTQLWIASREAGGGPLAPSQQPSSPEPPGPAAAGSAAAMEHPLDALIQAATGDAELASRLSAIGELESYAQQEARIRDLLSDLASNDSHPQVREAASAVLGGIP